MNVVKGSSETWVWFPTSLVFSSVALYAFVSIIWISPVPILSVISFTWYVLLHSERVEQQEKQQIFDLSLQAAGYWCFFVRVSVAQRDDAPCLITNLLSQPYFPQMIGVFSIVQIGQSCLVRISPLLGFKRTGVVCVCYLNN